MILTFPPSFCSTFEADTAKKGEEKGSLYLAVKFLGATN